MFVLPLAILLVLLMFIVELFSISMKITGLDIEKARFQVLSLLTSTGFTTRESELIVQHPIRRRIAKVVMVTGYISTASLVTVLVNAILTMSREINPIDILYILGGIVLLLAAIALFRNKRFMTLLDHFIEFRILSKLQKIKKKTVDEVLKLNQEYGVAEFIIEEDSPLVGVSLKESGLKQKYIQVLNIEGATHLIHFPQKDHVFEVGDRVVVYGKLDNIKRIMLKKDN